MEENKEIIFEVIVMYVEILEREIQDYNKKK